MKPKLCLPQLFVIVLLLALRPAPSALSQVPQGFNYQAIARDAGTGNPITDPIDIKIAILSDDDPVTIIREELFSAVDPDEHGLFSLVVGQGSYVSGLANFSDIDWTVTPKYILTKIYYAGDWQNLGPAQLWSVPYAMYSPSTNPWLTNGSNLYYSSGNVGIGTANPIGSLGIWTNGGGTYLSLMNSSTGGRDYLVGSTGLGNGQGEGKFVIWDWAASANRFTIDQGGRVGIGTVSPAARLHVSGADNISTIVQSNNTIGTSIEISNSTVSNKYQLSIGGSANTVPGAFAVYDGFAGQARIFVNPDGNVGIGTINPSYKLHVNGSIASNGLSIGNSGIQSGLMIYKSDNPVNQKITELLSLGSAGTFVGRFVSDTYLESAHWLEVLRNTNSYSVNSVIFPGGNVGVGAATTAKMAVQPPIDWSDEIPLFEVKNRHGIPVLAVYNNGVKINIEHDPDGVKGPKGGFAIGGYDYTKAGTGTVNLMNVTPDSIRFNINNDNTKGPKGGFAIGGFDITGKGDINQDFMYITPQTSNSGLFNTFLGYQSGKSNESTGTYNSFIGYQAGYSNVSADKNTFFGYNAGYNSKGPHNTFIGVNAGKSLTGNTSAWNIFIGEGSGKDNSGGYETLDIFLPGGIQTTVYNSWGGENIAIGSYTGIQLQGTVVNKTYGQRNILLGHYSGFNMTTGSKNVIIGHAAGHDLTSGDGNVFIGHQAGYSETSSNKLYIANSNTSSPLIYGDFYNGYLAVNGWLEVAGYESELLLRTTSGTSAKKSRLLFYGTFTGGSDFTARNFAQIEVGSSAGWDGGFMRFLGRYWDGSGENLHEHMRLNLYNGNLGIGTTSPGYKLQVGNAGDGTQARANAWNLLSDIRYKTNIENLTDPIEIISGINGFYFHWNTGTDESRQFGLSAQDVVKVLPEVVSEGEDGYLSVDYGKMVPLLIEGMKEQQKQIESQQEQIDRLMKMVSEMKEQIASSSR